MKYILKRILVMIYERILDFYKRNVAHYRGSNKNNKLLYLLSDYIKEISINQPASFYSTEYKQKNHLVGLVINELQKSICFRNEALKKLKVNKGTIYESISFNLLVDQSCLIYRKLIEVLVTIRIFQNDYDDKKLLFYFSKKYLADINRLINEQEKYYQHTKNVNYESLLEKKNEIEAYIQASNLEESFKSIVNNLTASNLMFEYVKSATVFERIIFGSYIDSITLKSINLHFSPDFGGLGKLNNNLEESFNQLMILEIIILKKLFGIVKPPDKLNSFFNSEYQSQIEFINNYEENDNKIPFKGKDYSPVDKHISDYGFITYKINLEDGREIWTN